jgi:hypothetical protein
VRWEIGPPRDRQSGELREVTARLRSAVKGIYGPNSDEYAAVGGTKQDDRKRPVRRNGNGEASAGNGGSENGN